ncbi:transposase [Caballeronia sp. TF1N1]|uniref:transposase n=1 Tax=Caballeronia sp. TF1N1 TaxID=2878153 RepID=UPI00351D2EB6
MGKYTEQAKLAAVKDYCAGHDGRKVVARRHGINVESLRRWAALYRVHGAEGVQEKRRATYSLEFKLSVLQRMRNDELSYRQVAALFDNRNFNIIGNWEHAYDEAAWPACRRTLPCAAQE